MKLATLSEVNAERAARRAVIVITDVADETAWNVGLSCGGTIRVFVEKVGQS